jgi:hypothetical protein
LYLVSAFANDISEINNINLDDAKDTPVVYTNSNGKTRKNLYYSLGFKIMIIG